MHFTPIMHFGASNMQAVDDTSEAVDVDGGLRATADEEKKYRP